MNKKIALIFISVFVLVSCKWSDAISSEDEVGKKHNLKILLLLVQTKMKMDV